MRFISSGFAALFFLATAGATPITLTFTGMASGSVGGTVFTNQTFTITLDSDTTALCVIGTSPCPTSGDVGDFTTPNPTMNTFAIGTITGELTGLPTLGPAVFLNPTTKNVGIWYYNDSDWLVTASSSYTSSFGLAQNLTVTGLSVANGGAFGNETTPGLGSPAMPSTAGAIDITGLSDVSFTEKVGSATGPSGPTGSNTPPGGGSASPTPEPSTLMMLGLGFGSLALGRIRRRRA